MINRVDIHFEGLRTWYKLVCVLHSTLLILFHYIVLGCSKMLFLVGNFFYKKAYFCWKQSEGVVFIFSSKTSVLPWFSLKQAENELKTNHVSDQRLSLGQNARFQKWAFSACFQDENDLFINLSTGLPKRSANTEPVFVDLLRRPGIDSQPGGPVRNPICRTGPPGYICWRNRFLGIDFWAP